MHNLIARRMFIRHLGAGAGVLAAGPALWPTASRATEFAGQPAPTRTAYRGPNVVIVRFGGGVRRRETIHPDHTYAPFMCKVLAPRATLYPQMEIDELVETPGGDQNIDTSHGQGTLHILTGKYNAFINRSDALIGEDFEPTVPTLFEYLRQTYDVPLHQTLIINNEDRRQEEFFTSSNHHMYGIRYKAGVLSLYRFKRYLFEQQIASGRLSGDELKQKEQALAELKKIEPANVGQPHQGERFITFWEKWRRHYGDSGLVNPRGDRLLTELAVWAIRELRPRMMMINYTDPDYVHWGNMQHYTRGIAVIDQGIERLVSTIEGDDEYHGNTLFVIVPDCGRDANPLMKVPCQHHFNSRHARHIFAMLHGPGVEQGVVVDKRVEQIQIASTVGRLMGFDTALAEQAVLGEALA